MISPHTKSLHKMLSSFVLVAVLLQEFQLAIPVFAQEENAEPEIVTEETPSDNSDASESREASEIAADEAETTSSSSVRSAVDGIVVDDLMPSEEPTYEVAIAENIQPTFDVEKQAEIGSAEELAERLTVTVINPLGEEEIIENVLVEETGTGYTLSLEPQANFIPGKYSIKAELDETQGVNRRVQRFFRIMFTDETGDSVLFEQDFTWGVLAFNPNRATYLVNEVADIHMGVLDDSGRTVCNADVTLFITSPNGDEITRSTDANTIMINPDCKDKSVTYIPDYRTEYSFAEEGIYTFTMTAVTGNGTRTMTQEVAVVPQRTLDVKRSSATRIYPLADYEMKIDITPTHAFIGALTEHVPAALPVYGISPEPREIVTNADGSKTVVWSDRLYEAGETYTIRYSYDPPDISPEFYLLGPLTVEGEIKHPLTEGVQNSSDSPSLLDEEISSSSTESSASPAESSEFSLSSKDAISSSSEPSSESQSSREVSDEEESEETNDSDDMSS